jgi:LPXTG-motif cell wall-anchored protein
MPLRDATKPTLVALLAVGVPLPLHAMGPHRHNAAKRVQLVDRVRSPSDETAKWSSAATGKRLTGPRHDTRSAQGTRHLPSRHRLARAADDPTATISDYMYSPSSLTIHVGDTVTWKNNGPSGHTATARNSSFDTGLLKKGQSASHTFEHAGTFSYYCMVHPFMHGTIVVLASTTTTTSSGSSSSGTSSGSAGSGTSTGSSTTGSSRTAAAARGAATNARTLPRTGTDLSVVGALGAALLMLGAGLRRRSRA